MNIANAISRLREEIEMREKQIAALHKLAELITDDVDAHPFGNCIDFNNPSRAAALSLIRQLPGKWNKSAAPSGERLNYENKEVIPGIIVRLYEAEPPPTCRMVEEEVTIPAQPERKEKRTRLICDPKVEV